MTEREQHVSERTNGDGDGDGDGITFAAIMHMLEQIHLEVGQLREQVEANTAAIRREHRNATASRRIIYDSLGIIKEDQDFYNGQYVGAFSRIGTKINDLGRLATHQHEITRRTLAHNGGSQPEAAEDAMIEGELVVWRKPRELPPMPVDVEAIE